MEYQVVYYRTSWSGEEPARAYIEALSEKERAKVKSFIKLLQERGGYLDEPYAKKVEGTKYRELIVNFGNKGHRVFYFTHSGKRIVLLHGFPKKGQKTPPRELVSGNRYYEDFLSYDE